MAGVLWLAQPRHVLASPVLLGYIFCLFRMSRLCKATTNQVCLLYSTYAGKGVTGVPNCFSAL
jgi:hypothetical protein